MNAQRGMGRSRSTSVTDQEPAVGRERGGVDETGLMVVSEGPKRRRVRLRGSVGEKAIVIEPPRKKTSTRALVYVIPSPLSTRLYTADCETEDVSKRERRRTFP